MSEAHLDKATQFVISNAEGDGVREMPKYFEEALANWMGDDPDGAKKLFASLWSHIKNATPDSWAYKNLRTQQGAEVLKQIAEKHGAHLKKP